MVKDVYKTKNSRFNSSTTSKKRIIIQQTQTNPRHNSPIKVLKRSKSRQQPPPIPTGKRSISPTKLPTVAQKIPAITSKPIPTAYIQEPSRFQTPSSTTNSETQSATSFQPRLPSIKDHVIKQNLRQKVTLRCKTPRPGSSYNRSTATIVIEPDEQTRTSHSLQKMDVGSLLSESARNRLKHLFKKLDTDQDGHLLYPQVQRCLPSNLPRAQLTFFHVLYNIISDGTFFGLQEFYAIAVIVEIVAQQDSTLWNHFLDDVDFNYYHENIVQLIEDFKNQYFANRGIINYANLLELIMKRTTNDRVEHISIQLEYLMPRIKTMKITLLDFLALLPAIIYIQSSFNHEHTLFRFREHSILDLHIRQALLT